MKIRSGFVSNSSSSSFIVELSKPAREYNLGEFISEFNVSSNEIEYAEKLLSELQWKDEEEVDLDDVYIYIDIDTSMLDVETESKLESKYTNLIKKAVQKEVAKNKKNNKYSVEYADDSEFGSYMEHDFMPYFKGTIESTNHH